MPAALPVLNVAGWFDAEDFYGPVRISYTLEKEHSSNRSMLAVGPWPHGGWNSMPGDQLGHNRFGSATSRYFQTEVQFPFFECHLRDRCDKQLPEAIVFETGSNTWRSYDRWPPRNAVERRLYLHANGKLAFDPPLAFASRPSSLRRIHPRPEQADPRSGRRTSRCA